MNGSFLAARTPKARLALTFRSCMQYYYSLHPSHRYLGFFPDTNFIEDYIEAVLDKELDTRAHLELATSVASTSEPVQSRLRELDRRNEEHDKKIALQLNLGAPEKGAAE